jgi:hypothetical protein
LLYSRIRAGIELPTRLPASGECNPRCENTTCTVADHAICTAVFSQYGFQQGCDFLSKDCGPKGWGDADSGVDPAYSATPDSFLADGTRCTYDRRAVSISMFERQPVTAICNGNATAAGTFNDGCTLMPWHVHFEPDASDGQFWYWNDTSAFRDKCPIARQSYSTDCAHGFASVLYGESAGESSRCFQVSATQTRSI